MQRLNQQQADALIVRLRELKVRPGLLTTAFWQLGWPLPPLIMMPFLTYMFCYLILFGAVYSFIILTMITGRTLFGAQTMITLGLVIGLSVLGQRLVARNRVQAWLMIFFTITLWSGCVIWAVAHLAGVDWDLLSFPAFSPLVTNMLPTVVGVLIGSVIRYYRLRRKRGGLTWRALVEQVRMAEAF